MKQKKTDIVTNEVRLARADVAKQRAKNPKKFQEDTHRLIKALGMKKSHLQTIKIDFSKRPKKISNAA